MQSTRDTLAKNKIVVINLYHLEDGVTEDDLREYYDGIQFQSLRVKQTQFNETLADAYFVDEK